MVINLNSSINEKSQKHKKSQNKKTKGWASVSSLGFHTGV